MIELPSDQLALLQSLVPAPLYAILCQPQPPLATLEAACAHLQARLNELVPFVPAPVLDRHIVRPHLEPGVGRYVTGTVLLARFSGFTTLAAQLAHDGRQGGEALGILINQLFPALIEEITARGGGIVRLNGTGITAFFDAAKVGSQHTALGAAAALALQARMRTNCAALPFVEAPRLTLQIAVQRGKLFFTEVGDANHADLILSGRAMTHAVAGLEHAGPGEIMVTEDVARALVKPQTQPKGVGYCVLNGLTDAPEIATAPVVAAPEAASITSLAALLQRITAAQAFVPQRIPRRWLRADTEMGEFRPVTVLAANFDAFGRLLTLLELSALMEHDAAIMAQVLQVAYQRIQTLVQQYGGTINSVEAAGTGQRWLALFGAPTAHEDDPARAVQAALALRTALLDTRHDIDTLLRAWLVERPEQRSVLRIIHGPLRQRVGIATGTVYAGIVGSPQRREYAVLGTTGALATQFMAAAGEGEILLSELTQRAISTTMPTQPLLPLVLHDWSQPVPVFRVLAAERDETSHLSHSAPFIGRQVEVQQIEQRLGCALSQPPRSQIVAIVGDAGVGKTRLVEEAIAHLKTVHPHIAVARAVCYSYEQTTPYTTIAQLARQLLEIDPAADRHTQQTHLVQRLEALVPAWSRFAPLLGTLLKLQLAETPLIQSFTPEQRNERFCDLVLALCGALAQRQPLLLAVDDLQWADASSLVLLSRLAAEMTDQGLELLLIYRPTPHFAEPWRDLATCTTLELRELPAAESAALAEALLGSAMPAALGPIINRANGSPFFIEHTIRYMLEAGLLQRDAAGVWQCSPTLERMTTPGAVEQLIVARLDQLPEDSRALVQVAAAIGQTFEQQLLSAVDPLHHELKPCLDELVAAALLEPDIQSGSGVYRFKQPLVRDVIYSNLLSPQRRSLHGAIARAMEQLYAERLEEYQALLAHHYYQAEQWDQALRHLINAARAAQGRYANTEALALYQQACAIALLCETPPERSLMVDLYENMGDVQALTGSYESARSTYERALARFSASSDQAYATAQAALQRKIGSTYEHQGRPDQALMWLGLAVETVAQAASVPASQVEQARILSDMGWVHFRQNNTAEAQQHLERALNVISAVAAYDEQARILNRLGGVAYRHGDLTVAEYYVYESLIASERSGDLIGQAHALNNLGNLAASRGQSAESITYGLKAMDMYERLGSRRELAITGINVGWSFYEREAYTQAAEYLDQALQWAIEVRDVYHQMLAALNLGRVLIELRDGEAAARITQQGYFAALQLQLPAEQLEAHTILAEIALQRGDLAGARQEYEQGQHLGIDLESEEYGRFQRLEAKLAIARGDVMTATHLLGANVALFTRLQNAPEATRSRALMDQLQAVPVTRV